MFVVGMIFTEKGNNTWPVEAAEVAVVLGVPILFTKDMTSLAFSAGTSSNTKTWPL